MGDWNCNGIQTPGLYRQSDGFVYLRFTNTQGPADRTFFFGNPGDVPLAGDFNNDGCDTVSIYRPSNQTLYIINQLGQNGGGLGAAEFSYVFGNPGDKPFVGDFDGDGVDTVGLHRESTGFVYFRNSHTQGNADAQFFFGNPDDRFVAGDWNANGVDSPGLFRPSSSTFYFRYTNTQGNADDSTTWGHPTWLPVSGRFGLPSGLPPPPPAPFSFGNGTWEVGTQIPAGRYRMISDGSSCYWERLSGFSGELADIIANSFDFATQIVDIDPSDAGFHSSSCNIWSNDLGPRRANPSAPLISDGHYLVGLEVSPGTWANDGPAQGDFCYWERLSGFSGELADIIVNEFTDTTSIVSISSSDVGFYADPDCGTWTKIG